MSGFSDVDGSERVAALVSYLRATDRGLAAMKAYMTFAAQQATGDGLVVDIGCGLGQVRLESVGVQAIGLEPSSEMVARARDEAPGIPLIRGDGSALPFRSQSVDGCRVERVLQHVSDPAAVLAEMARVVRSGGQVCVFEPDYGTFRVDSEVVTDGSFPAALMRVRNPRVGAQLAPLLENAGFRIDDVVTESSRGYDFDRLPIAAETVVMRAVADGRCDSATAERWLAEQRERSGAGSFRAAWDKLLVVATRRAPG